MAQLVTFDCPSCGAPIKTPNDAVAVECEYCGNNIMVPEELRSAPAPPSQYGPTIIIGTGTGIPTYPTYPTQPPIRLSPEDARKLRRSVGCGGVLVVLFLIAIIVVPLGVGAWAVISELNPGFVEDITGQGFARKEMSFGGKGRGPGLFEDAVDLTSDAAGDIYVLEGTTGRVQRFDKSGKYLNGWVVEGGHPSAIAADRETGEIYVVSSPKIHKYEGTTGNLLATPVEEGLGFFGTDDVAIFPNGDLLAYVLTSGSGDLVRVDPQGQEVRRFPKAISTVYGDDGSAPAPWLVQLAVNGSEQMLVLNTVGTEEVLIFEPDGTYNTRFGGESDGFSFPSGIAVDSKNRVYVSDVSAIHVFDSTGRSLAQINQPLGSGSARAIEVTDRDEILVIFSTQEIAKFVLREP